MLMLILILLGLQAYLNNFNTSHVNVNRQTFLKSHLIGFHFNTSHVNVNPTNLSLFNHA